jgi:hypothetical protein
MGASGDSAGCPHSLDKFFLVLPRGFPRQFDLDVYGFAIRNAVPKNIGFAMLTDIHDATVLCIELSDRVVSRHAAVHAQGGDNFILKRCFGVYDRRLPLVT